MLWWKPSHEVWAMNMKRRHARMGSPFWIDVPTVWQRSKLYHNKVTLLNMVNLVQALVSVEATSVNPKDRIAPAPVINILNMGGSEQYQVILFQNMGSYPSPPPDPPTKHFHFCLWCLAGLMYISHGPSIRCPDSSVINVVDLVAWLLSWGLEPSRKHSFFPPLRVMAAFL